MSSSKTFFSFSPKKRRIQNFVLPPIQLSYVDCTIRKTEENIIRSRILDQFKSKLRALWKDLSFPLNTYNFLDIPQIDHISTEFKIYGGTPWIYKTSSVIIVEITISIDYINIHLFLKIPKVAKIYTTLILTKEGRHIIKE